MLLYALLHLTGYDLELDELKHFRQLGSRTPGHPEVGHTPGVETTTGPLGQGLANAVGMALAEKLLAQRFNKPDLAIVDHHTYAFVGDGCLMEGISHEVCSLAGVLKLNKLIVLYDDNGISIDGDVRGWYRDDTAARFRAYGWNVLGPVDGHSFGDIDRALRIARSSRTPTLIVCRTKIGWGSPAKEGSADVHGAPLGAAEVQATREALGWSHGPFEIPQEVRALWDARVAGAEAEAEWQARFDAYRAQYPDDAREFERRMRGALPEGWPEVARVMREAAAANTLPTATRKSSQQALETLVPGLPELLGGSADLTGSNLTATAATRPIDENGGNYAQYGVREFGMAAIMNGAALHGGFIPYGGTFAVFSDYARSAVRMSALMRQRVVHVLTHDSIGLGEDGPTHQPVEHLASLRVIPHLDVWRPCDGLETAVAWQHAVERRDGPSALMLSRQNLPQVHREPAAATSISRGGYVLADPVAGSPDVVVIATGSEVSLALEAQRLAANHGVAVRVVSMPCTSVFDRQPRSYRDAIVPPDVPAVAVEAGHRDGWYRYVGRDGEVIGLSDFGASAPAAVLYEHFGITAAHVAEAVLRLAGPLRARQDPRTQAAVA